MAAGGEEARGCHVSGTYSRLCRLWLTFRASAKATEPLSPTELLESLRQEAEGALPAAVSQPEPLPAAWGPQPPALQRDLSSFAGLPLLGLCLNLLPRIHLTQHESHHRVPMSPGVPLGPRNTLGVQPQA